MPHFDSLRTSYNTPFGEMIEGDATIALTSHLINPYVGNIQLIFTSPPFPLNTKKAYGNRQGAAYTDWLLGFASIFRDLLAADGSIVIEIGNSWTPGAPVMSTLGLKSLLAFVDQAQLHVCQQFVCQNPARLPSPAQWVTIERIRVKDSFTHIWWMSPTERPKANNRNVLIPYSSSMKKLLSTKTYNSGLRPSEHDIGARSFLKDNGGAIPPSVLMCTNTTSNDPYLDYCRLYGIRPHPARMASNVARFFIEFLTDPGDLVLDPFAGSNVTGAVAESLGRRWVSIEMNKEYARSSKSRFGPLNK